jgi:hypothetical protein
MGQTEPLGARWKVRLTTEAEQWLRSLEPRAASHVGALLELLSERGPQLRGRYVKRIKGSRHHNLKELRALPGNIRVLFAFDRERAAIVLIGGDKTGEWNGWYRRNVARADALFERQLRETGQETRWRAREAGTRSSAKSR